MGWTLRPVVLADRGFLERLHELAMRPYVEALWGWDPEAQQAYFDEHFRPHDGWSVIVVDGAPAGRLVIEEREREVYLAEIELLPSCQGRGVGSEVIAALLASAAKPVELRVLHVNPRARALYERLGFRHVRDIETHAYLRWEPR